MLTHTFVKTVQIAATVVLLFVSACRPEALSLGFPWDRSGKKKDNVDNVNDRRRGAKDGYKEVEGCRIPRASLRAPLHRLSASEFDATIQQVLGLSETYTAALPIDNRSGSYENSLEGLVNSATMVEKFWSSAESLSSLATEKFLTPCGDTLDSNCLKDAIDGLATAVYRRPLFPDERKRLGNLPKEFAAQGASTQDALKGTAMAMLLTPQFLFRANLADDQVSNIDQYALAERLSYFLWGSAPDETLMRLAREGDLRSRAAIKDQINRMLEDTRSDGFIRNFAGQWLGTKQTIAAAQNNNADVELAKAFEAETLAYFREFIRENINVRELLGAKFTYLNPRLASHYGLPFNARASDQLQRVELSGSKDRGGILTQGAFLVQTSNPTTTSPVKRGKWILEHILCSPPAPAPNNEAARFEQIDPNLPMRERVARHSSDPGCAGCHKSMDPLGLGLENYDFAGSWRNNDRGSQIDASGELPGAGSFASPGELMRLLQDDPRFPTCVAKNLATYALGREPNDDEMCVVEKLGDKSSDVSYGLRDLLIDLSLAFLTN